MIAEALVNVLADKSKEVKAVSGEFAQHAVSKVDAETIEQKIREQRPFLQEDLRKTVKRLLMKRSETDGVDINYNLKRVRQVAVDIGNVDNTLKPEDQKQGARPHKNPAPNVIKFKNYQTGLLNQKDEQENSGDVDFFARSQNLDDLSETNGRSGTGFIQNIEDKRLSIILNCVSGFLEPADQEVALLVEVLSFLLNDQVAKSLFAFETNKTRAAIEGVKKINVFDKQNMMKFFQYSYIRVFDTRRSAIISAVEGLLEFVIQICDSMRISFKEDSETTVFVNSLVRVLLSGGQSVTGLMLNSLNLINSDSLGRIFFRILNSAAAESHEQEIFDFIEKVCTALDGEIGSTRELVLFIHAFADRFSVPVSGILASLQNNIAKRKILSKKEFISIYGNDMNNSEDQSFNNPSQLMKILDEDRVSSEDMIKHADSISDCLVMRGDELIVFLKRRSSPDFPSTLHKYCRIVYKFCSTEGIFEKNDFRTSLKFLQHFMIHTVILENLGELNNAGSEENLKALEEASRIFTLSLVHSLNLNNINIMFEFNVYDSANRMDFRCC